MMKLSMCKTLNKIRCRIADRNVCWYCGGRLIWNSDFNYDEVHGEGEGVVSYLTCANCSAEVEYSLRTDEEE